MKKYILALDEGTTSARAIIFNRKCEIVSSAQQEFTQLYPQPGFVEHDPLELYSAQYAALTGAVTRAGISPADIAAIGITNQRETTVIWDRQTGVPVYNAIVWQCRRTHAICEELKARGLEDYIRDTTGLRIDAYFSATKIKWILDNVPGARKSAESGKLLFGTIDTFLLWKLSGGNAHITDRTNASRTMLYDIHCGCWDEKLLRELDIPACMLPTVASSGEHYCDVNILGESIPVCGMAGDQQAALFGQCCFTEGSLKNTYGTGCFLLMNTGEKPFKSTHGLITTMAATVKNEPVQYALEGSVFVGGAVIQWLRDELKLISSAAESETAARRVNDSGGVYIVPAFAGLGAPYWDMYARGTVCGLTRGSGRDHIIRAALEAIAYQTNDLIVSLSRDTGITPSALLADGGAASNSLLMQLQSDISDIKVVKPVCREATAMGAAFLAGLTSGFWSGKDEILSLCKAEKSFTPEIMPERRREMLDGWKRAVKSARAFTEETSDEL